METDKLTAQALADFTRMVGFDNARAVALANAAWTQAMGEVATPHQSPVDLPWHRTALTMMNELWHQM